MLAHLDTGAESRILTRMSSPRSPAPGLILTLSLMCVGCVVLVDLSRAAVRSGPRTRIKSDSLASAIGVAGSVFPDAVRSGGTGVLSAATRSEVRAYPHDTSKFVMCQKREQMPGWAVGE